MNLHQPNLPTVAPEVSLEIGKQSNGDDPVSIQALTAVVWTLPSAPCGVVAGLPQSDVVSPGCLFPLFAFALA